MLTRFVLAAFLTTAASLALAAPAASDITADGAWVREVPPASSTSAAFLRLHNHGRRDLVLTGIDTPVAHAAELHVMSMSGGLMHMDRLPSATIPAGGDLVFDPDSKHIMLFGLKTNLRAGQHVPLTLHFRKAADLTVDAVVKSDAE